MDQNPEDATRLRRFQKHFQSPHIKTKSPMLSNYTRFKTEGEKRQNEVIRKQMFDRMFMQKQLSKSNNNSNKPYSNGFNNNLHFVDHSYSSKKTDHRYQSNNSSRNSTTESEIRLRLSQRQNETLFQMLTKSEQQISILKQLLKQKQFAIHDKEKIIRRFIKERIKYSEQQKYDNHVQNELLNSNITIQSLKAEILKHLATQNLMRQKIHSLQKKVIQFPYSMKDKQYQQIIKQKQNQLEKIQSKTLRLKTDCDRVQNIKTQNSLLKQRLKTYQSQQTNNCPSSPINRISNKFQQQLSDTKPNDSHSQDMIADLIEKLATINYKLKQREQYCYEIQQKEEDLKKQILLKQQEINRFHNILKTDSQNQKENLQKTHKQQIQIQLLKQKIKEIQIHAQKETKKLEQNLKHFFQQNKVLTKKNTQLNENVILNLSQLDSIEKYNEELKEQLEREKKHLKQKKQEVQTKNIQLKRYQGEAKINKDLTVQNNQLKTQIQFLKKVTSELQRRITYSDKAQSDLQDLNKQYQEKIQILQSKLEVLRTQIQQFQLSSTQNSNYLLLITGQKSQLTQSYEQLKSKYQMTLLQLSSFQKNNQNLIQIEYTNNTQINHLNNTISQQSITITILETKLSDSQKISNQFQTKIQSLNEQLKTTLVNFMSLQEQVSQRKNQFQIKSQQFNNDIQKKHLIIEEKNSTIIILNNKIEQKENEYQQQKNEQQKEIQKMKNQNKQLISKILEIGKVVEEKDIFIQRLVLLKDKSNVILEQNSVLIKDNKQLSIQTQSLAILISELNNKHQQQTIELKKQIEKLFHDYDELLKIHQQLLIQEKQYKDKIKKDQQSQYYDIENIEKNDDELKNKMLENQRKYSQLLEQQIHCAQNNKSEDQSKNIIIDENKNNQKIIVLVKELSLLYHSDCKNIVLQSLTDQKIILLEQEKQSQEGNKRVETETTSLELDASQSAKTRIFEIVTNIIKNNSLIDILNKFLYDVIEQNNGLMISEEIIIQFCNSLKQFEDEVEKRLSKINGFLKNSSDAFEFNSNIEQSQDQNSSIKDSNFDESFKQDKIQECSISYQNYQFQTGNRIKQQINSSIQYQQSFKSLIPPKVKFNMGSQTSIRPMSQHSKLSSIKLKLFQDQKSGNQSELISESSLSTNNFKNDYQKKLKNKLMHISRDPYKKGKKSKK